MRPEKGPASPEKGSGAPMPMEGWRPLSCDMTNHLGGNARSMCRTADFIGIVLFIRHLKVAAVGLEGVMARPKCWCSTWSYCSILVFWQLSGVSSHYTDVEWFLHAGKTQQWWAATEQIFHPVNYCRCYKGSNKGRFSHTKEILIKGWGWRFPIIKVWCLLLLELYDLSNETYQLI